jgi:ABC-type Zn2+ transport system substrate-binding protein/surface adhesin
MDASVRPDATPAASNVFTVSPSGDCAVSPNLQAKADRIKRIREEMEARKAQLKAAEDTLRSKVGLSNSVTSGPVQRTMRSMESSRLTTRTS